MAMLDFTGGSFQENAIDGSVYGSGNHYEMDAFYAWDYRRIWRWNPSNATAYVRLPDPATWPRMVDGGPVYYMENLHPTTYGIRLYTSNGVYVGEIGPQNSATYNRAKVYCLRASTNTWVAFGATKQGLRELP